MTCSTCGSAMSGFSSVASAGDAEDDYLWECPNGCDAASPGAVTIVVAAPVGALYALSRIFS